MAKLSITIPAVNVLVDGKEYRKVDRKAQAGDIVKALVVHQDIAEGAFYAVYADGDGDPAFRDDGGDERCVFLDYRDRYETFAPVSTITPDETATVTFEGATYRKVDRPAREGDAIKFTEDSRSSYLKGAELYVVDYVDGAGDPQITDDDEDSYDTAGDEFDVYEKAADEAAQPSGEYREVKREATPGELVKITGNTSSHRFPVGEIARYESGKKVRYLDGHDFWYVDSDDYVVLEPIAKPTYAEVKRKAAVGERIKIVNAHAAMGHYVDGDELTVKSVEGDGRVYVTEHPRIIAQFEYVVLEPVTAVAPAKPKRLAARLTVGDYARVVGPNDNDNDYEIGTVVQIAEDWTRGSNTYTRAKKADGQLGNYIRDYQLEPATEAEFLAQRKPAEPARLKVGDYAKLATKEGGILSGFTVGTIVQIVENPYEPDSQFRVQKFDGGTGYADKERGLTQATPEEVSAAQAEAQRKIAVGPFADGGFAVLHTIASDASLSGFSTGEYVKVTGKGCGGRSALTATNVGGSVGYCNSDALRQITEDEYNAATQPKAPEPAFSVGDSVKLTIADGKSPNYGWGSVKNGDVGTVIAVLSNKVSVSFPKQHGWNAKPSELTKVTAEEVVAIEKEAQETAKWAALGRKVGEYKIGDIVRYTKQRESRCHGLSDHSGIITEVTDENLYVAKPDFVKNGAGTHTLPEELTLIVPVEQRFDKAAA